MENTGRSDIAWLWIGSVLNSISFVQGSYTSYAVTTSIAIVPRVSTGGFAGGSDHLTSDDFQLAEDMADSVSYVIYSDRVLEQAIEQARLISGRTRRSGTESWHQPVQ